MLSVNELIYGGIPIALLNLSIVEFLKKFFENNKLIWIFALTIGIIEGIVLFSDGDLIKGVLVGVMLGLSSIGMYSSGKNTIEYKKEH